jgi:hypothetical protein
VRVFLSSSDSDAASWLSWEPSPLVCFPEDRVTFLFGCKLRGENLPCLQCFRRMPCSWDLTAPRSNLSFPYLLLLLLLLLPQEGIVCGFENSRSRWQSSQISLVEPECLSWVWQSYVVENRYVFLVPIGRIVREFGWSKNENFSHGGSPLQMSPGRWENKASCLKLGLMRACLPLDYARLHSHTQSRTWLLEVYSWSWNWTERLKNVMEEICM